MTATHTVATTLWCALVAGLSLLGLGYLNGAISFLLLAFALVFWSDDLSDSILSTCKYKAAPSLASQNIATETVHYSVFDTERPT